MMGAFRNAVVQAALVALLLLPCLALYLVAEAALPAAGAGVRAALVSALLLLAGFVFPHLKVAAHERLDTALVRWSGDYRRVLTRTIGDVATVADLETLAATLAAHLTDPLQLESLHLWIRDASAPVFRQVGDGADLPIVADAEGRALDRWIATSAGAPWDAGDGLSGDVEVDRLLQRLGAALCFPLRLEQAPLGLLVLGPRTTGRGFLAGELALLHTLASQVASAAEHARLCQSLSNSKRILERTSGLLAVGTVAAGLAHEIRNPLVAVQTFLQILPDRLDDPEVTNEFRTVALAEVRRVSKLIGDLLGMTRTPGVSLAPTDLEDVVDQVVRLLRVSAERSQIELRRAGSALPMGYADAPRLKQALLNLVLNAIQASPAGAVVTVGTCTSVDAAGRRFVEIAVRDQGPGIPTHQREAIFDPFFTTKEAGTGLGLAMARQIVVDHGGEIHVASEEGAGSTFFLQVPLEPASMPVSERAA